MTAKTRSEGVNPTEKVLGWLCDRAFLKAWTYLNPYRAPAKELCDLLVVFNGHIFIFEIKSIGFDANKDVYLAWQRWERKAVTEQLKKLNRAKNWILKHPDQIYLDAACKNSFPIDLGNGEYKIHKILVAHGAAKACKNFSDENIAGSLWICYEDNNNDASPKNPFMLFLDKQDPVHVLDSHNFDIVLGELDTACDFTQYLVAKEHAIEKHGTLVYCGEEDLLAHYFLNYDESGNKHYIGVDKENVDGLGVGEGEWDSFHASAAYKRKTAANEISYLWDALLQRMCELALDDSVTGNDNLFAWRSPIYEMAKESRMTRRYLAKTMRDSLRKQKNNTGELQRYLGFRGSYQKDTGYVFFWTDRPAFVESDDAFFKARHAMLEIACGVAKNRVPQFNKIVGIAYGYSSAGKFTPEDFMLLDCTQWTEQDKAHYEEANQKLKFFDSLRGKLPVKTMREFP